MEKIYALFDFDGTLIGGDSIILFMRYALRHGLCSAADLARFLLAGLLYTVRWITPKRAKEMGLRFLHGKERAVYAAAAEDFCRTELLPRMYKKGLEALRRHQEAGQETLLVSASPAFYLEPLKRLLGFTEIIGTRFAADENGRFADEIIGENCRGEQKPLRIQEYLKQTGTVIDFQASSAYGDSAHDLPMLSMCGHVYVVNPGRIFRKMLKVTDRARILTWEE
jgi:HAD superfamily hydrolase (TIGR01490 family)